MNKCPGHDTQRKIPDILEMQCNECRESVELWPPDYKSECPKCGNLVEKKSVPSCADWCPGGEKAVQECLGEDRYKEWLALKNKNSA